MEDQQFPSEDHHLPSGAARNTVIFGKYETGRLLGKGTFAKVKKEGFMEQIEREISVMRLVRHPNVVEITEVMATKQKIFFIMEYVKDGELFAKIAKGKLKEDAARNS